MQDIFLELEDMGMITYFEYYGDDGGDHHQREAACLGHERERHEWWPVGTELVGKMGSETFTAMVVENPQVKSGRSLLITSGPASGKVCITPTRAAIEATSQNRDGAQLMGINVSLVGGLPSGLGRRWRPWPRCWWSR
jgi:hypothetical protein